MGCLESAGDLIVLYATILAAVGFLMQSRDLKKENADLKALRAQDALLIEDHAAKINILEQEKEELARRLHQPTRPAFAESDYDPLNH